MEFSSTLVSGFFGVVLTLLGHVDRPTQNKRQLVANAAINCVILMGFNLLFTKVKKAYNIKENALTSNLGYAVISLYGATKIIYRKYL